MAPVAIILKSPPQSPSPTPSPTATHYAFTPKPTSKIPRAWERKPSTPFAPRNESQKIWKRYEFRDTNMNGTVQSKTTETHALKKLRLEGKGATAYITSWDEELHETTRKLVATHKQSAHQDRNAFILPSLADPTTTTHNVESPVLVHENDRLTTPHNSNEDVEDQDAADELPADQDTRSFFVERPSTGQSDLHRPSPESTSVQAPPKDKQAMARQPESEREQDLMEQSLEGQFAERGNAVSPQAHSLTVDEETPSVVESGEEGKVPVKSPAKDRMPSEEPVGPSQSTDRAAAHQLDTTLEEALKDETAAGQQQQATDFDNQPPPVQAQITHEVVIHDEQTEALEEKTLKDFSPPLGDTELEDNCVISQERGIDGASQQPQLEDLLSDSIQDIQPLRHEKDATNGVEKENNLPESPLRADLPTQAQNYPSKAPTAIQDEDTDYLHAFLTRAKAKKAARGASPQKVDRVPPSPMTRSRAALVPLSTNSPSPKKTNKHELDTTDESEVLDTNRAGSPYRRSGRTRLPRPQKAPTVTPSTIPVRRSNGTEFVFLQSTDIAQVALATRSNTKRNKGEAVMPKMKLQALSQAQKSPSKSPKTRKGKEVSWKEEPTYFGMQADDAEEAGERRKAEDKPRARKIRRLGAANGTPAPKKMMAEDAMDVRTPVLRKRGKVKA